MATRGEVQIDPPSIETGCKCDPLEIVVPFTEWVVTQAVIGRVAKLTAQLNAHILLIAVHTVPYPMPFGCPALIHAHLVEQVVDLASRSELPVQPRVVLARNHAEGFKHELKPESTVVMGTRRRLWKTSEERLAAVLAYDGHHVVLMHVE